MFTDGAQYGTGVGIKAHIGMDIANLAHGFAGDLFDIDPGAGGDLAANQHHAGFHVGFAGYAGFWILFQDGIKNGIRDLIGNFIRMSFGNRFGREEVFSHGVLYLAKDGLEITAQRWRSGHQSEGSSADGEMHPATPLRQSR
ncbi:hypothetical protein D3C73_841960 [compost metagenome]